MTLDTIDVPIPPHSVRAYINMLDERGEVYQFNVTDATEAISRGKSPPLKLTLQRDGCADALELTLALDGTWSAAHVIVVGEKI